jgi:hypothetical protein
VKIAYNKLQISRHDKLSKWNIADYLTAPGVRLSNSLQDAYGKTQKAIAPRLKLSIKLKSHPFFGDGVLKY